MVEFRDLKTARCPTCGCEIVVKESISVDTHRGKNEIRTHCNGERWETRRFLCGFETSFIPNYSKESPGQKCQFDPEEIRKEKERVKTIEKVEKYIGNLKCDSDLKEGLLTMIKGRY